MRNFNYLMKIGKFPDELKVGKITPIYKKGDKELLENYRPVSTLPIFGKIFEKIIYERIYNFLISKRLIKRLIGKYELGQTSIKRMAA